jgi:hypothetical protein
LPETCVKKDRQYPPFPSHIFSDILSVFDTWVFNVLYCRTSRDQIYVNKLYNGQVVTNIQYTVQ